MQTEPILKSLDKLTKPQLIEEMNSRGLQILPDMTNAAMCLAIRDQVEQFALTSQGPSAASAAGPMGYGAPEPDGFVHVDEVAPAEQQKAMRRR